MRMNVRPTFMNLEPKGKLLEVVAGGPIAPSKVVCISTLSCGSVVLDTPKKKHVQTHAFCHVSVSISVTPRTLVATLRLAARGIVIFSRAIMCHMRIESTQHTPAVWQGVPEWGTSHKQPLNEGGLNLHQA